MLFKAATIFLALSFSTASAQSYCSVVAGDIRILEALYITGSTQDELFEAFMVNKGDMSSVDMADYAILVIEWVLVQGKDADDFMVECDG